MPPQDGSPVQEPVCVKRCWCPRQGIGPCVSWHMQKILDLLTAGKSTNGVDINALNDDDEKVKRYYPPCNTVVLLVLMETDVHGLSFEAGAGLMEGLWEKQP